MIIKVVTTPTGALYVSKHVAEQLLQHGDVRGTMEGTLEADDESVLKAAIAAVGVCDFCSAPQVTDVFRVPDFPMPGFVDHTMREVVSIRSVDGWGACSECAALIRAQKRSALLTRAIAHLKFPSYSRGTIAELHEKFWRNYEGPRKPLIGVVPHWQQALDMKFAAAQYLKIPIREIERTFDYSKKVADLTDSADIRRAIDDANARQALRSMGFDEDARFFDHAQAYSFNAETIAAIREAAESIPHDAPLSSIDTPSAGAGWFWFADPLPITASPVASDRAHALLWGWSNLYSTPALAFSVYVIDERGKIASAGTPVPSTRWYWPINMTFHDMIGLSMIKYDQSYGPGGPFANDPQLIGRATTLDCVADMSLFFMMACLWFKQTVPILVTESGHIERHARKRYMREHKLHEPPTVQVVALRKTARVQVEPSETLTDEKSREYHCRWIVRGHPRLQACGPGRKDRKLIWIDAHPAGPPDKPLRVREKVFAVVR